MQHKIGAGLITVVVARKTSTSSSSLPCECRCQSKSSVQMRSTAKRQPKPIPDDIHRHDQQQQNESSADPAADREAASSRYFVQRPRTIFCSLCECEWRSGVGSWQEHVRGIRHQRNLCSVRIHGRVGPVVYSAFEDADKVPLPPQHHRKRARDKASADDNLEDTIASLRKSLASILLELGGVQLFNCATSTGSELRRG